MPGQRGEPENAAGKTKPGARVCCTRARDSLENPIRPPAGQTGAGSRGLPGFALRGGTGPMGAGILPRHPAASQLKPRGRSGGADPAAGPPPHPRQPSLGSEDAGKRLDMQG